MDDGFLGPPYESFAELLGDCQFTGLVDKDGSNIFEGDIMFVHTCGHEHQGGGFVELVKYEGGGFYPFCGKGYYEDGLCEPVEWPIAWVKVIGNKYQNPEILENVGRFVALSSLFSA